MKDKRSTEVPEMDTAEAWENAKAYGVTLGEVPSSFSSAIRGLQQDQEKLGGELSPASRFQATRLLKGPTGKAMFFYASKTFFYDQIEKESYLTIRHLVNLYQAFDLAAIIALIYVFRRANKLCTETDWKAQSDRLQLESEVGGHLGNAIPSIGLGTGLIVGALHHIAHITIKNHDPKGYVRYAQHLKKQKVGVDVLFEFNHWGCTSYQISSSILQSLGFGVSLTENFLRGFDPLVELGELKEDSYYRMRITKIWIDSLLRIGDQPTINMKGAFYPLAQDLEVLKQKIAPVRSSGPVYSWLLKKKEDVCPEKTPQLFREKPAKIIEEEQKIVPARDYPQELLEFFSLEELNELSQEELDKLIEELNTDLEQ